MIIQDTPGYEGNDIDEEVPQTEIEVIDTCIVSDIHLGSDVSRSAALLRLLRRLDCKRLILNGDVFDDLNFKRLSKSDWKFLSYLRKLSNPKRGCEVVWVAGNHDGVAEILSHLLGVPVYEEYTWEFEGKRYLAIHGHQFDSFITERVLLTEIATRFYLILQKADRHNQRLSRWVKRSSKTWLRLSDKIACDAIAYARRYAADVIFCGHTHIPLRMQLEGIEYLNSGCWTDIPSQFITIDQERGTQLREAK